MEILVFSQLCQPCVGLYQLTFSSLDAFSKDTESDSDLGWILIGRNCFLYNRLGKKQSVHMNRVQGSYVGRRARSKAINFI